MKMKGTGRDRKLIVYMAPTVTLVIQQASYIRVRGRVCVCVCVWVGGGVGGGAVFVVTPAREV